MRKPKQKSTDELILQRELFLNHLEEQQEFSIAIIEELRRSNALTIKERLKNVFTSYETAKTIDSVRQNVEKVLSKNESEKHTIEKLSADILQKYNQFLKVSDEETEKSITDYIEKHNKNSAFTQKLIDLVKSSNSQFILKVFSVLLQNGEQYKLEPNTLKNLLNSIDNSRYSKQVALQCMNYKPFADFFMNNYNKLKNKSWVSSEMFILIVENGGENIIFSQFDQYKNEPWMNSTIIEVALERLFKKEGAAAFFDNFEKYSKERWVDPQLVEKAVDNGGAAAFFNNIEKYENEKWLDAKLMKKLTADQEGAKAYFNNYNKLDNQDLRSFKLVNRAAIHGKGSSAIYDSYEEFSKEEWFDEKFIHKTIIYGKGGEGFFRNIEKYITEDWITEDIVKMVVKTESGAKAFFENIDLYMTEDWVNEEILSLALKKEAGIKAFFENMPKYSNINWVIERMLPRVIVFKNGPEEFFKNIEIYMNEEWVTEQSVYDTLRYSKGAAAFIDKLEKIQHMPWLSKNMIESALSYSQNVETFLKNLNKYTDIKFLTPEFISSHFLTNYRVKVFCKHFNVIANEEWVNEEFVERLVSFNDGAKVFIENIDKYEDKPWFEKMLNKALTKTAAIDAVFEGIHNHVEEGWISKVILRLLEKGEHIRKILEVAPVIPKKILTKFEEKHYLISYIDDIGYTSTRVYKSYKRLKDANDTEGLKRFIQVQRARRQAEGPRNKFVDRLVKKLKRGGKIEGGIEYFDIEVDAEQEANELGITVKQWSDLMHIAKGSRLVDKRNWIFGNFEFEDGKIYGKDLDLSGREDIKEIPAKLIVENLDIRGTSVTKIPKSTKITGSLNK